MKFQFLGTAAAEGWPAAFCNCRYCKEAIRLGGRNIRTRSQSLVNGEMLIDFPPDTYMHKLAYGLDLTAIKYLLVTHKHMDHFFPQELAIRGGIFSHDMTYEKMSIYCAKETKEHFDLISKDDLGQERYELLEWHILKPFVTETFGQYQLTPLPASHMGEGNEPFVFHIVDENGTSVLYLLDSGYYKDEVWDYFEKTAEKSGPVSMVVYDTTDAATETDHARHMGFSEVKRVKQRMSSIGIVGGNTICVLDHFSHNGKYLHYEMTALAEKENCIVAYDGMELNL